LSVRDRRSTFERSNSFEEFFGQAIVNRSLFLFHFDFRREFFPPLSFGEERGFFLGGKRGFVVDDL